MTNMRILVVEDDPDSQEMIVTVLQHMNYNVDTADTGEQASKILRASGGTYNAIVLDLALPGRDGWELLNEILDNPSTKNLPCVAMTAFHNSKLREEALRAGFSAYFAKPVDTKLLGNELDRLIGLG